MMVREYGNKIGMRVPFLFILYNNALKKLSDFINYEGTTFPKCS